MRPSSLEMKVWVITLTAALAGPQVASAATVTDGVCMQRTYGGPTVTSSNKLNCTANDIAIARAVSASPETCTSGELFDLTATFEVNVNATERYDAGFYFRVDGGPNARGPAGECSLTTLDVPPVAGEPWSNRDGDYCGDFQSAGTVLVTIDIGEVLCSDTDGDHFLNLPNCTSWHSNRSTPCGTETQAIPETKSKCKCDDTFQVPVIVESPTGAVVKTAKSAVVTYEVQVKNNSQTRSVTIKTLVDDIYGSITTVHDEVLTTNCSTLINDVVGPGGTSDACQYTIAYANPGTEGDLTNTVTAHIKATTSPFEEVDVEGSATINVNLDVTP